MKTTNLTEFFSAIFQAAMYVLLGYGFAQSEYNHIIPFGISFLCLVLYLYFELSKK